MGNFFQPKGDKGIVNIHHIYVDESQITRVMKALDSTYKEARPVLKQAINNTAKEARNKLVERAREVYLYKKSFGSKDLKLTRATTTNLVAKLYNKGYPLELIEFSARGPVAWAETVKGAPPTRAHAIRGTSLKNIMNGSYKAFIAKMPSGHRTIVRRSPDWASKDTQLDERYLETILTISMAGMIGNEEKVWNYVSPELGRMLETEVTLALNRRAK